MGDRLYHCWHDMHRRCTHSPRYLEKHITVCTEWDDFEVFKKWARKNGYRAKLTLDRIDNAGNYTPENCRWATKEVQVNNRDITKIVEYAGESKSLAEWAKVTGIEGHILYSRLHSGWTVERAFTQPARAKNKKHRRSRRENTRV